MADLLDILAEFCYNYYDYQKIRQIINGRHKPMENERSEIIEDRVNAEPVPFTALGIDLNGMPGEIIKLMEDVYRATRRNALNEHAIELEQMEEELRSSGQSIEKLRALIEDNEHIQLRLQMENDHLKEENAKLKIERDDATSKRDAAVREKEENDLGLRTMLQMAEKERDELRAKLEQYEKAAEYQARQDQPISMTEEETNSLQASADAVKKLFASVEDWGSIQKVIKPDGTFELATRAEVESEWAPVPPELTLELPSFREEDTASNVEDDSIPTPEAPEAVTEDTFPGDVLAGHSDTDAGEAEKGEVTRAEFEELKRRVEDMEGKVGRWAA